MLYPAELRDRRRSNTMIFARATQALAPMQPNSTESDETWPKSGWEQGKGNTAEAHEGLKGQAELA